MRVSELITALSEVSLDAEVRIGDVSEGSDLHCSVGVVVRRSEGVILVPGDDDVWKDETLSSEVLQEFLWPTVVEDKEEEG